MRRAAVGLLLLALAGCAAAPGDGPSFGQKYRRCMERGDGGAGQFVYCVSAAALLDY